MARPADRVGLCVVLITTPIGPLVAIITGWADWQPHLPAGRLLLTGVVLAPLVEEIIFRGGLQALMLAHLGQGRGQDAREIALVSSANLVTSLVFAAAHVLLHNSGSAALVFFPSLVLGWLYERRRSLIPVIGAHGLYNLAWSCLLV